MIKRICKCLIIVSAFFLLFIVLLLIQSAKWLKVMYGDIAFSTVMFQLLSPLKGTEQNIVHTYIYDCIPVSIIRTLFFGGLTFGYTKISSKISMRQNIRILKKNFNIRYRKYFCLIILVLSVTVVFCFEGQKVGLWKYLNDVMQKSTIYEEEFVSVDEIEITFPEQKQNLILIYMESMETTFTSKENGGGKEINYIPELTKLAEENVNFSNSNMLGGALQCEGTSWTMGGILASSTGVNYKLPIDHNSERKYKSLWPGLKGIGNILRDAGYDNYYMCGSDAGFAGKNTFLEGHGNYEIYDYYTAISEGLIDSNYKENWGFEDKLLYQWAKDKLSEIGESGKPFNFTILTADTHFPEGYICDICQDKYPEQYANVISCASRQVYEFVLWIQEQEWYEDTTIVILGDHLSMNKTFYDDIGDYNRVVFNCFINPMEEPDVSAQKNRQFSSMDFCPTIISALGGVIEKDRIGLGTNLMNGDKTLIEEMGFEYFNDQLKRNSIFYLKNLCVSE